MTPLGLVPTPNEWLAKLLKERDVSRASLAKVIGRSREEVQRWANGREQVPRYHLAEIARQLGTPRDLQYVLRLKDCEDIGDRLRRHLRDIARRTDVQPEALEGKVFPAVSAIASAEFVVSSLDEVTLLISFLTDAEFVFRLFAESANNPKRQPLLTPETISLHLRYPVNHFVGLGLGLGLSGQDRDAPGGLPELRAAHLEDLRRLTLQEANGQAKAFVQQHAIHILARHGNAVDHDNVEHIVSDARFSDDLWSKRLGFVGLIMRGDDPEMAERYRSLLEHNEALARVDLLFDAIHYGDLSLSLDGRIPGGNCSFDNSISNLLRHYEHPEQYASLFELDSFRMISIMDRVGESKFTNPQVSARVARLLSKGQDFGEGRYAKEVQRRLIATLQSRTTTRDYIQSPQEGEMKQFDVFMAYNTEDEAAVEVIAIELSHRGLDPWFAKWHLPPGKLFQEELESAIPRCSTVAIFVGPSGIGPWERMEMRAAISQFVDRQVPVIPVLLPGSIVKTYLPLFLKEFKWVRFLTGLQDKTAIDHLEWGITGRPLPHGSGLQSVP
jgi:hypothetical protein